MTALRVCSTCGEGKPATLEFFHSHKAMPDGLNPRCKVCRKSESSAYYLAKGDAVRARSRAWQEANPQKANAKKLEWALPNLRPMWAAENIAKGAKVLTLV